MTQSSTWKAHGVGDGIDHAASLPFLGLGFRRSCRARRCAGTVGPCYRRGMAYMGQVGVVFAAAPVAERVREPAAEASCDMPGIGMRPTGPDAKPRRVPSAPIYGPHRLSTGAALTKGSDVFGAIRRTCPTSSGRGIAWDEAVRPEPTRKETRDRVWVTMAKARLASIKPGSAGLRAVDREGAPTPDILRPSSARRRGYLRASFLGRAHAGGDRV